MKNVLKKISKDIFFKPVWWVIVLNPYFIARRGLYVHIKSFANHDFSDKTILDVGCGIKPYQSLFNAKEYIGIDIEGGGHHDQAKSVDQFFDGLRIPYNEGKFDLVICTQVLEHSENPEELVSEMYRILKKRGFMYMTMPFVWGEHEIPYDFRRFTRYQHEKLLKSAGFSVQMIEPTCGVFGVSGQLVSAFIFEKLGGKNIIGNVLTATLLCFPVQLVSILLDTVFKNNWITLDYIIVAKKYS